MLSGGQQIVEEIKFGFTREENKDVRQSND